MMNKNGWMRILEATIAVMIVSGVLITVYSRQIVRGDDLGDYYYTLQRQILADISLRSDLRIAVLNANDEESSTLEELGNYSIINDYVAPRVPDSTGYYVAICRLDSEDDFCKMNGDAVRESLEKDVFVEDMVISSDLGDGPDAKYNPKKVRIYMWQA